MRFHADMRISIRITATAWPSLYLTILMKLNQQQPGIFCRSGGVGMAAIDRSIGGHQGLVLEELHEGSHHLRLLFKPLRNLRRRSENRLAGKNRHAQKISAALDVACQRLLHLLILHDLVSKLLQSGHGGSSKDKQLMKSKFLTHLISLKK